MVQGWRIPFHRYHFPDSTCNDFSLVLGKQLKRLKLTKAHPELAPDTIPHLIVPTAHAPVRDDGPPSIVPSQLPLFDLLARA